MTFVTPNNNQSRLYSNRSYLLAGSEGSEFGNVQLLFETGAAKNAHKDAAASLPNELQT